MESSCDGDGARVWLTTGTCWRQLVRAVCVHLVFSLLTRPPSFSFSFRHHLPHTVQSLLPETDVWCVLYGEECLQPGQGRAENFPSPEPCSQSPWATNRALSGMRASHDNSVLSDPCRDCWVAHEPVNASHPFLLVFKTWQHNKSNMMKAYVNTVRAHKPSDRDLHMDVSTLKRIALGV